MEVPKADSATTDLARLTTDPDDGDADRMKYELVGGVPAGFDASIDGKSLKASAKDGTAAGAGGAVQVKATDPRGLEATATYQLTVTASNRPKPVANDDLEPDAAAGKPVTVRRAGQRRQPVPGDGAEDRVRRDRNRPGLRRRHRRLRDRDPGRRDSPGP